ncbi:MAG: S41 family peptidase, partial [Parabacteroides sp.]|nr:S41 family peptidase [Parabacteroides sp.]
AQSQAQNNNRFEVSKNLDILNAIVKETEMFYVDSLDVEKTVRRGIDAMLEGLDPYTEYYPESEMDKLKFMTTGEYGGIGSYIRGRKEGGVYIVEPFEGSPAALAGIKPGDRILGIDTVDVTDKSSDEVSALLKGAPNTKVTLKIKSPYDKKPRTINLMRKQIEETQVIYYGVRGNGIGYIYLKGFTDKSPEEVKSAYDDLRKNHHIKALVFDLRNDGGGVLESAAQIVSMFVPKGKEVVTTKGKMKQLDRTYRTPNEPIDTVMPIAVLVNGNTASAAEIVAGSLQDMDRAVIIGERSFGKGLVQSPRELPYNGSLKITTSKYYIPSGRCIQLLDYSKRNEDGSVGAIPDSLTSIFYTSKGRPVSDGCGITPDIKIEEEESPTMMYYLVSDFTLIDFIAKYALTHKTIPTIDQFQVTDEDFEAFKQFAKEKNFTYDRQSVRLLKNLKEVAKLEGYLKSDSTIFNALEAKLTPDLSRDFDNNKDKIKKLMATEIARYYYFQKGVLLEGLKNDKVLGKALEVLDNSEMYHKILSTPEKSKTESSKAKAPASKSKKS